jgi:hypothetical protein
MHCERQVCSAEDNDVPGLGTQASKQCSLTFYKWEETRPWSD